MSKVALVTGGTTGLGAAICAHLGNDGYRVIANYFPALEKDAQQWQQRSEKVGINCAIAAADVSLSLIHI